MALPFFFYYLTVLSVSRLNGIGHRMINEYGAAGGIRIDRGILPQWNSVHHKSQMT
jgi:hypothetical protein